MILGLTLAGLAFIGLGHALNTKGYNEAKQAYETFRNTLQSSGLGNADTRQVIDRLYQDGELTFEEYKGALKEYNEFEKQYKDSDSDYFYARSDLFSSKFSDLKKFYDVLNKKSGIISEATLKTADQLKGSVKDAFLSGVPNIQGTPGYTAFDESFDNPKQNAEYMRLMTGQEMADLHSLDYNPDTYYDLIKQGTEAKVNYANYLSQQMNEASMIEDTKNVNSYLDSIRNNKAEALASGATAGARAAQEVLGTKEAINNYATNQTDVANQRYSTVEDVLLEDAQAKLTAKDYFNNLAQSLSTDAGTLYANDAERYRGEQAMYGNVYSANEYLRQARINANASMARDKAIADASIASARNNATSQIDAYMWMLDRYIGANKGNTKQAQLDFEDYIRARARDGHYSFVNDYLNV